MRNWFCSFQSMTICFNAYFHKLRFVPINQSCNNAFNHRLLYPTPASPFVFILSWVLLWHSNLLELVVLSFLSSVLSLVKGLCVSIVIIICTIWRSHQQLIYYTMCNRFFHLSLSSIYFISGIGCLFLDYRCPNLEGCFPHSHTGISFSILKTLVYYW